jgi:hypothetical protein
MRHAADHPSTPLPPLDPRWLDAAVDSGSLELVCDLARPNHEPTHRFLSAELTRIKKPYEAHRVLETIVRTRHPEAADIVIDAIRKLAKETSYYYYGYWFGRIISELPKSALPKIEELLPTLPEKMIDALMDSVLALKNKAE